MTDWQRYNQLKAEVIKMRAAQIKYFTTKDQQDLRRVKALEKVVDKLVSNQVSLF